MDRKLIWIGAGCWFPDSLLFFKEHGVDVVIVKTDRNVPHFSANYGIYSQFGFKILPNEPDIIRNLCNCMNERTLVVGGGYFGGDIPTLGITRGASLEELEILYQFARFNHQHDCGAKCLRYFNGDTGFGSEAMINMFERKIKWVDVLMFDNDLLRDFVLHNSGESRKKKCLLGYMESPLERFVIHNRSKIERRIISIGRCFSQFDFIRTNSLNLPITFYPLEKSKNRIKNILNILLMKKIGRPNSYQLAGRQENIKDILSDRSLFRKWEGNCAFGISHMHDIFHNSIQRFLSKRDYYWSLHGQYAANGPMSPKEQYYAFVNNPSKDVAYMMFGIIPLIAHTENSYYKALVENRMALLIKEKEDLKKVCSLPNEKIQEYRDNIYENRHLFTFDHTARLLLEQFN